MPQSAASVRRRRSAAAGFSGIPLNDILAGRANGLAGRGENRKIWESVSKTGRKTGSLLCGKRGDWRLWNRERAESCSTSNTRRRHWRRWRRDKRSARQFRRRRRAGGVPHPLRRAENFPGPDRLDPGEAAPGGPVWDVSSLPGALEEILSVDLLEPEGLHDEGAGRAYALTAEPEFSSIVITSAALPWKGQTRTMAVTLFPNSAGQRITDDTAGPGSVQGGCAAAGSRRYRTLLQSDPAGINPFLRGEENGAGLPGQSHGGGKPPRLFLTGECPAGAVEPRFPVDFPRFSL